MPGMLVIENCIINYGDDRGGVTEIAGALVEVNKDTARTLADIGRALYVDKKDDPDKYGRHTADAEMVKAAKIMAKGKAE